MPVSRSARWRSPRRSRTRCWSASVPPRSTAPISAGHRPSARRAPAAPARALGLEWAGEVEAVGREVKGVKPGDRVMGSGAGGFRRIRRGRSRPGCTAFPANNMNFEQAACLAGRAQHHAQRGGDRPAGSSAARRVLIQGASSGVGLMAMQIAKLKGATLVIGTSTDAGAARAAEGVRRDLAVDSSDPGWVDQVLKATGGKGVDLIVDQVSGQVASQNMKAGDDHRPHRQCRPARRHACRLQFRSARATHRLYRRHLPHPAPRKSATSSG